MQAQEEFEAEVLLGVFHSARAAADAEGALGAHGIESTQSPLRPGRYQVADLRLGRRARASVGAAFGGAVIGAAVGAALGLWFFGGTTTVVVWLAVAGAFGGAIVGPLYGIARMSRYDDDAARTTQVEPGMNAVVVRALTPRAGATGSAREILQRAGAVALLDVPAYEASLRATAEPALVMESTSAGDAAAPSAVPPFGRQPVRGVDDQK